MKKICIEVSDRTIYVADKHEMSVDEYILHCISEEKKRYFSGKEKILNDYRSKRSNN